MNNEGQNTSNNSSQISSKSSVKNVFEKLHSHNYVTTVIPANCLNKGYTLHKCSCGEEYRTDLTNIGDHNFELSKKIAPTCTKSGSDIYSCTVCKKQKINSLAALGHSYGDWQTKSNPKCTIPGKKYKKCEVCGLTTEVSIPAVGHTYGDWEVEKYPECLQTGSRIRKCLVCGALEKETMPAPGHCFGEWLEQKHPTCTKSGSSARQCEVCGAIEKKPIPASHAWSEWHISRNPNKEERTCKDCGKTQYRDMDVKAHQNCVIQIILAVLLLLIALFVTPIFCCDSNSWISIFLITIICSCVKGLYKDATYPFWIRIFGFGLLNSTIKSIMLNYINITNLLQIIVGIIIPIVLTIFSTISFVKLIKKIVNNYLTISTSFCIDGITYQLLPTYNEYSVIGCNKGVSNVTILSTIHGLPVTKIEDFAFCACPLLTNITIPNNVTSLGNGVFKKCISLTNISIPNSVTSIGRDAFACCISLISITIPNSLINIGNSIFAGCPKLVEVINLSNLDMNKDHQNDLALSTDILNVKTSSTSDIVETEDNYLFYTYNSTNYLLGYTGRDTILILPANYHGQKYEIYKYAFFNHRSLTSITIPYSVTSIGDHPFFSLITINYTGTKSQWEDILIPPTWLNPYNAIHSHVVHCTDGDITL